MFYNGEDTALCQGIFQSKKLVTDVLHTKKDDAIMVLTVDLPVAMRGSRLSKYILSEGRPEIREDDVVTPTAIEPLEATVEVTTYNEEIWSQLQKL